MCVLDVALTKNIKIETKPQLIEQLVAKTFIEFFLKNFDKTESEILAILEKNGFKLKLNSNFNQIEHDSLPNSVLTFNSKDWLKVFKTIY